MAKGYEKIIIAGNVGRNPEMRYTQAGLAVTEFSVAINRKRHGEEKTKWFSVVCFDRKAEYAAEWVRKGDAVVIEGTLSDEPQAWVDTTTGQARGKYEISASVVNVLSYSDEPRGNGGPAPEPRGNSELESYF